MTGCRPSPQTLTVDRSTAWFAGELRRRYHSAIGVAAYLIAATAHEHGCELATLNVRHFPMVTDLAAPFTV